VVAEDLLELELAAAFPVDPLGPVHEPLVEHGSAALQQAAVGGVADDLVPEPEEDFVIGQLPHELLRDEHVEVVADPRPDRLVDELGHRVHGEGQPDHGRWVDDRALLAPQGIETRGDEGLHGRRDL